MRESCFKCRNRSLTNGSAEGFVSVSVVWKARGELIWASHSTLCLISSASQLRLHRAAVFCSEKSGQQCPQAKYNQSYAQFNVREGDETVQWSEIQLLCVSSACLSQHQTQTRTTCEWFLLLHRAPFVCWVLMIWHLGLFTNTKLMLFDILHWELWKHFLFNKRIKAQIHPGVKWADASFLWGFLLDRESWRVTGKQGRHADSTSIN